MMVVHALRPRLRLALLAVALGAATLPAQTGEAFEPIRFGDPDELAYDVPFFGDSAYDPSIPTPASILGQPVGSRLAHHAEIVEVFDALAAASDRVTVERYARTYEGRELVRAVVTSPRNQARLDAIRADLAQLADPRGLSDAEAEHLARTTPAVAWMGYSIHGDEVSGADASMAFGHHLAACTDADVAELLERLVIVIDPCSNPDGRERIVSMVEQSAGYVSNLDVDSMHRGRWPWGRGNHYLFDLNRDWMLGLHPETRGRWAQILSFHPQLLVDAHEMGALDTYLFYPQSPAYNPHLPGSLLRWQSALAADHAAAFDRHGWSYYTREWADAWAPFYTDAFGSLIGAIGMLYEQAGITGAPIRRESGRVITYRETVHHQAVSSLANVRTLAREREAILADYVAGKRFNVAADTPGNDRALVIAPGRHPTRERALLSALLAQGVEVERATEAFEAEAVVDTLARTHARRAFPEGAWIVRARQPAHPQVMSYLDFDPRMNAVELLEERTELEREGQSKIYDLTSWSVAHAFDLDAVWCAAPGVASERLSTPDAPPRAGIVGPAAAGLAPEDAVAFAVDGQDDAAPAFAARALGLGLGVHLGDEPFTRGGRTFARGSLVVRANDNDGDWVERVARAAQHAGVQAWPIGTSRASGDDPDLGGGHFTLLERPRVAILSNMPIATDTYGHLWYWLDVEIGLPFSILDAQDLVGQDLRRFNVLVLPPHWGGLGALLEDHADALRTWVAGGGTLIAVGNAAATVADEELGLSEVRLRRAVLEELDDYAFAAELEASAREIEIDEDLVWGEVPTGAVWREPVNEGGEGDAPQSAGDSDATADAADGPASADDAADDAETVATAATLGAGADDPDAERRDRWLRRFSPRGAFVRGYVNPDAWITAGCGPELPVPISGSSVYLTRTQNVAAVRLAPANELRLSGLLWPEARERLANSAAVTVESNGSGQVILIAEVPGYRGLYRALGRLFANAVVYGPGAGASPPRDR